VNETVLNTPANPLLVVNQRLQLVMAERRKQRSAQQQAKGGQPQESRLVSARAGTPVLQLQGGGLVAVPVLSSTPTQKQSR